MNMIFTAQNGALTLAPQSATEAQHIAIQSLMKSNPYTDGSYGRYSDGRVSVQIGEYGYERAIIDINGTITTNF